MSKSARLDTKQLSLAGSVTELDRLAAELEQFCEANELDAEAAFQLNLVLEELFTNSYRHGGCEGVADSVHILLKAVAGDVLIEYADRGRPYNPLAAPAAKLDVPLEERHGGGMGIHLVKQLMRDLQYDRDGEWNRLKMRRPAGNRDAEMKAQ